MVKRPLLIIVIAVCAATAAGVWLLLGDPAPGQAPASGSKVEAAKQFFGTPKKYDMTTGQEMRPRW